MEFIQGTLTTLSIFGILCQSAITEANGVIRNGTVWHDTNGEGTIYLYVGDRYSQHHGKGTGRNIFLPLIWDDGVPKLKWYESWKIDIGTGRYQCVDE